ncbi:hypothetical protein MMC26_002660 [Xylographa opegraphella]|nr:hypothetical protein [Xylographa opegraphella]
MISIAYPSLLQVLVLVSSVYCIYRIRWELTTGKARRRLSKASGCAPIPSWPVRFGTFGVGLLIDSHRSFKKRTLLESEQQRFETIGSHTFQMTVFRGSILVTREPENLKRILSTDFTTWSIGEERKRGLTPLLGEGIFTTEGAAWEHSRNMLRPTFVRSQIGDVALLEKHVGHLVQAIPRDGSMVDLQPLFFRLTLDTASEFLFGESVGSLAPGIDKASSSGFEKAWNYSLKALNGEGQLGLGIAFLPFWMDRRLKRSIKYINDWIDGLVDKGLNEFAARNDAKASPASAFSTHRYVILHELAAQTTDKVKIRSELLNTLLAGRDTTASLLSNIWFTLSQRPDVYARIRDEVDALDSDDLSFETLKDMKYLRAVINESLRLYPVVPMNSRKALNDTVLPFGGGKDGLSPCFIAKGQFLIWNVYAMHRRTDFYGEDADLFRPERWLDDGETKGLRVGWNYLPFNGGPRICIGQQLALTEASYVTVRLMQEFSALESRDPEPWQEMITLTCTGFGGCKVVLTPRI